MPAVAVVGAFIGAGELIAGGLTVMETISAVGAVAAGIGAVTGNKSLMAIGGVAALAGGIGAFAQGKGWIASDGPLADTTSNISRINSTEAPGVAEALGSGGTNPTDMRLAAGTQTTPMGSETSAIGDAISQSQGGATGGLMNANVGDTTSQLTDGDVGVGGRINGMDAASDSATANGIAGPGTVNAGTRTPFNTSVKGKTGVMSMFSDFSSWANKNPTLAMIGAQFVGGFFDANKRAQTNYYNAKTDEIRTQIENGKTSPNMNFRTGSVGFPTQAPTYHPVNVGLYGAKG